MLYIQLGPYITRQLLLNTISTKYRKGLVNQQAKYTVQYFFKNAANTAHNTNTGLRYQQVTCKRFTTSQFLLSEAIDL